MTESNSDVQVRGLEDADLGGITELDEKIVGRYRPEVWERRLGYYMRRDPDACVVAELDGKLVGFMFGEVRSGEFGLEEPTGWVEHLGVDPDARGRAVGRQMAERMLDHFKIHGARRVRTLVDESMGEDMEGIAAFFLALGFEPASLRPLVKELDR